MNKRMTMTYAVAAGVAATVLLAGCNGGEEDPTTTPTPSSSSTSSSTPSGSTSSTASPSSSVSVNLPSAARAHTEDGAKAFGKFFITSVDEAYVSQDSSVIESLSTPNCGGCKSVVTVIKGMASSDERQAKPALTIAGSEYLALNGDEVVDVFASYAAVERIRAGKVISPGSATKTAYRLTVAWTPNGWRVAKTDVLGE